jgi:sterol desaturase/sphingolipid hydroxylase (fatty acid hydroxylase superfamily)
VLGIPLGLAVANLTEWTFHKYVLHGLGKNRKSFWSFHWHEHHRAARKHGHVDEAYRGGLLRWNGQTKEALTLAAGMVAVTPLLPVAPFFVGTIWYSGINYYRKHRRAHLDPAWARANLPWHYEHHMGREPDANWCVTRPWADRVLGTVRRPDKNATTVAR